MWQKRPTDTRHRAVGVISLILIYPLHVHLYANEVSLGLYSAVNTK